MIQKDNFVEFEFVTCFNIFFLSTGIPGIKGSLLQEFGVRLITYDLPGFGESDPHPQRNLESSAMDMLYLSYAVHITDKFWVVGYSCGSIHTWAALKYIPDRIAGISPFSKSNTFFFNLIILNSKYRCFHGSTIGESI